MVEVCNESCEIELGPRNKCLPEPKAKSVISAQRNTKKMTVAHTTVANAVKLRLRKETKCARFDIQLT